MPKQPSRRLTFYEAVEVWNLHWLGYYQHQIAAKFDVNQGRISEILNEQKHIGSQQEARRLNPDAA